MAQAFAREGETVAGLPEHITRILGFYDVPLPQSLAPEPSVQPLGLLDNQPLEDLSDFELRGPGPVGEPQGEPMPEGAGGLKARIHRILDRIDQGRPEHLSLGELVRLGVAAVPMLIAALRAQSALRRWAAATALGKIPVNALSALKDVLRDPVETVRLAAARSLLRRGSTAGMEALVDAIPSEGIMVHHPPVLARSFARNVLRRATGLDFGPREQAPREEVHAARERWDRWWRDHRATFQPR
jgi:hypothetical protein